MSDDKHKKINPVPPSSAELDSTLKTLKDQIQKLSIKQQYIINEWIKVWNKYLGFEKNFDPKRLKRYKHGELIHIHLGFNIGSEEGGSRFAIVMDNKNDKNSKIITVIPVSTLEEGETKEDLHESEVYLGKVIPDSEKEAYALPLHIRGISKIRIIKPKLAKHAVYMLGNDELAKIDNMLITLFTHK